jgi:hypothetical protein
MSFHKQKSSPQSRESSLIHQTYFRPRCFTGCDRVCHSLGCSVYRSPPQNNNILVPLMDIANIILPFFPQPEHPVVILDTTCIRQGTRLKQDVPVPCSLWSVVLYTAHRRIGELGFLIGLFSSMRVSATSLAIRLRWGSMASLRGCFSPWQACEAILALKVWM